MELMEVLQEIQSRYGYLPADELKKLPYPLAEVLSIASFYSFFRLEPGAEEEYIEKLYPCCLAGPLLTETDSTLSALKKTKEEPAWVLMQVKEAELCGRGGGAFPTGRKWELTKNAPGRVKYVVCNADEGEPGTGKDRIILERNPAAVLEGMAICAAIIGAKEGYIYLRGEYADLKEHLEKVIGALALDSFSIHVRLGMGAYVCGEETALLESLESKRGEPRLKPPYPGVAGYQGCPTVINNVETFACVPAVVRYGAEGFQARETRVYTVSGCVKQPGVYECVSGSTVEQMLTIAGGTVDGKKPKAVQIGGGSGTILRRGFEEIPLDVEGCRLYGVGLGTGSVVFIGQDEDLRAYVTKQTKFYAKESCGFCVPCREGLKQLVKLLEDPGAELAEIRALAEQIRASARCGLGQAAVTPVLSWLEGGMTDEA